MTRTAKPKAKEAEAPATEKFDIRNRFSGEIIFTAELTCSPDTLPSIKLGLAVKAAVKARANLAGANLTDANLTDANLAGAYLAGAYLTGACLTGANLTDANLADANLTDAYLAGANLTDAYLTGANLTDANLAEETLRPFKADLFLTLDTLHAGPAEALFLIHKLRAGEVDGSTYGESGNPCACLVGTIANALKVRASKLDSSADRPAERWFMMIKPGDKPGTVDSEGKPTGGGYAAQKALGWVLDWCACHGVDPDQQIQIVEHSI